MYFVVFLGHVRMQDLFFATLLKGLIICAISYGFSSIIQKSTAKLLQKMPERNQKIFGLLSGMTIFFSLLMAQDGVITYDSITFRAMYATGCSGFALINSESVIVMALQNAFVLLLAYNMIIS
jgi:hypothetical protein